MVEKTMTGAEEIAWRSEHLYTSINDPQIDTDLAAADERVQALSETYRGRIAELDSEEMRALLEELDAVYELAVKPYYYASMLFSVDTSDAQIGALMARMQEHLSRFQQEIVFITLEVGAMQDKRAQALIEDPVLADYKHWIETTRLSKPYLLSEPEERILSEKAITGSSAWGRYFTQLMSASRYEVDGEMVTQSEVLNLLHDPDRERRELGWQSLTDGLRENLMSTTFIFNTLLADKASNDRLRGYPTWITSRNISNEVDDESVEALVQAVTSRYDIVSRYYILKQDLLGVDELFDYDRYAPLPAADAEYSWDQAQEIVMNSFGAFHPRMAEVAGLFFNEGWIDAPVRPNKRGGAYATPTVPSAHPYIFLNYLGRARDVETLAHELGHGIHMYLSRKHGMLLANTPLTTAETASVFAEMLVFQDLLAKEEDPATRLAMVTAKIESSFATVFRQISMNRFEHSIHTARREEGELSSERLNELWLKSQRDMFGDSVTMTDNYGLWWSYVPHFLQVPGYVYAYSFGELLVLALYAKYQSGAEGFADAYIDVLSMGGSDWPHEIMKKLDVDLTDPHFWHEGLDILEDLVEEAEKLSEEA